MKKHHWYIIGGYLAIGVLYKFVINPSAQMQDIVIWPLNITGIVAP